MQLPLLPLLQVPLPLQVLPRQGSAGAVEAKGHQRHHREVLNVRVNGGGEGMPRLKTGKQQKQDGY